MTKKDTSKEKGFAPIIIIVIALVVLGIVGATYYFSKSNASPLSSNNACLSNKDAILGLVVHFENLQKKMDAKGVLQLFTPPQTPSEKKTYIDLSGSDNGNLPRLYGNVSLNINVLSYKVTAQPTKAGDGCSVMVEENRSYYGGPANPQYLPGINEEFKLTLTQKNNTWLIDQYQSQDPKIKPEKYSGWIANFTNTDRTSDWKTYINTTFGYSISFPNTYKVPVESDKEKSQLGVDTNICVVSIKDEVCQIVVSVFQNNENLSLEDWLAKNEKNEVTGPLLKYTFNGYDSLIVKNQPGTDIFLVHKSNIYQINAPTASSNKEIADILSSFKFTQ